MFIPFLLVMIGIVIGICVIVPNKANYTKLDITGIVFNILLGIVYVPLSWVGISTVFFADSIDRVPLPEQLFIFFLILLGLSLPCLSIVSIGLSVLFRKSGKKVLSFLIQFLPLVVFLIMIGSVFLGQIIFTHFIF